MFEERNNSANISPEPEKNKCGLPDRDEENIQTAKEEQYQEVELFKMPALFSNERVSRDELPAGVYCYDLRGSDYDPGNPISVENRVGVNHAGSVLLATPLKLPESGYLLLKEENGLNFSGAFLTLSQFLRKQKKNGVQR